MVTSNRVLTYYDPGKPIQVAGASIYGVEAVLSHKMEDGTEWPIAFASSSLTSIITLRLKKRHWLSFGG